jgi:iron complex outermembrane receptor protein
MELIQLPKILKYMLWGTSYREGEAAGFIEDQISQELILAYIQMVSPEIHLLLNDVSAAAGLRGKIFENWNFDLSNTYGKTDSITIFKTLQMRPREKSPTEFDVED